MVKSFIVSGEYVRRKQPANSRKCWRSVRESNPCRRREREATYCNSKELRGMDSTLTSSRSIRTTGPRIHINRLDCARRLCADSSQRATRKDFSLPFGIITSHFRVGRHLYGASAYRAVMKLKLAVWEEAILLEIVVNCSGRKIFLILNCVATVLST
jgi:hypothetical protein